MVKKILLLSSLLLINTSSSAKQLNNYDEVQQSVKNGERVTFVVETAMCSVNMDIPAFLFSWTPDGFAMTEKVGLRARGMTYTPENSAFPQTGPVYQSYTYTLNKSGNLHFSNRFLDPVTFAEKAKSIEVDCQLGNGARIYSLSHSY